MARRIVHHASGDGLTATHGNTDQVWDESEVVSGMGLTVWGKVLELRNHTLQDGSKKYHRYQAVVVEVTKGHNRVFDEHGQELESQGARVRRDFTGFLSSHTVTEEDPDDVTAAQIAKRVAGVSVFPPGRQVAAESKVSPAPNRIEFWAPRQSLDWSVGQNVRFKTRGASFLIECAVGGGGKTWAQTGDAYAGDDVGASWADKIMATKGSEPDNGDDGNDDDDSWSD